MFVCCDVPTPYFHFCRVSTVFPENFENNLRSVPLSLIVRGMKQSKFVAHTKKLLSERPRSVRYEDIERATGIPRGWLKSLARGSTKDPSCARIETLYEFLSGKPLNL